MKRIQINEKKKVVTCILNDDNAKAIGIARCHPDDKFDVDIGKKIAIKRAKLEINKIRMRNITKYMNDKLKECDILQSQINNLFNCNRKIKEEIESYK